MMIKEFLKMAFAIVLLQGVAWAGDSNWEGLLWNQDDWHVGSGSISGRVTTSLAGYDNLSVINARIRLDGTDHVTSTDVNGFFVLEDVPEGTYVLTVRSPSFETANREVAMSKGEPLQLNELSMTIPTCLGVWDGNSDNRLDLADIIYALQLLSGMGIEN